MKILLVSGRCISNKANSKYCGFVKEFINTDSFKNNGDKLAFIFPSDVSEITIKDDSLINFSINSVGDKSVQIPDFNPVAVNEIFNFLNDFNADIVVSFDNGYLGFISQVWAVQKKVPYALFNTTSVEEFKSKTSRFLRGIFKNTGLSGEFYNNFYHNCTAIFVFEEINFNKLQEISYKGTIIKVNKNLTKEEFQETVYSELNSLIKSQPTYIKSTIFKKIVDRFKFIPFFKRGSKKNLRRNLNIGTLIFAGGAVLSSIIAFSTWKGLNKIKHKISKPDTN